MEAAPVPNEEVPAGFISILAVSVRVDGGTLHGTAHITIPVDPLVVAEAPPETDQAVPVLHLHDSQPNTLVLGRLDRVSNTLAIDTTEFSIFQPLIPSSKALAGKIGEILNGALGELFSAAVQPACDNEAAARTGGWTVTSTAGATVRWCFGMNGGRHVLTIANGRRYPLAVSYGSKTFLLSPPPQSLAEGISQSASDAAGLRHVILGPGATAELAPGPAAGASTTIQTEFDGLAQALNALEVAAELITFIADRLHFGTKSAVDSLRAIDVGGCVPKLLNFAADPTSASKLGAMLSACLHPKDVFKGLGGVVLTAVITAASVLSFVITSFEGVLDQIRNRSDYKIVVSRGQTSSTPATAAGCADLQKLSDQLGNQFASHWPKYPHWTDAPDFQSFAKPKIQALTQQCGKDDALAVINDMSVVGPTYRSFFVWITG